MNIITDKTELVKLIDSIQRAGKKLDADIQRAGVSALSHLKAHGDIGFVNRLYLALAKGHRKAALVSWFLSHGALLANTMEDKATKPFVYTKDKETNVEAAQADPWFDHKPDPAPDQVYDLAVALEKVLKACKGKELVHGELVTGIQGLLTVIASKEPAVAGGPDDDQDAA